MSFRLGDIFSRSRRSTRRSALHCRPVEGWRPGNRRRAACRRVIVGALSVCCASVHGQTATQALVELALDEPTNIVLDDVRLGDAIQKISQASGVPIYLPPDVLDLAPYGRETIVRRIELRHMSLRRGLMELLSPLGMTFRVSNDHVEVQLLDVLRCLGRAPTWEELDTLARLSALSPGLNDDHLAQLKTLIRFDVADQNAWTSLSAVIRRIGAGSGVDVLTQACPEYQWGWCFEGRGIVVASAAAQYRRRLMRPVSLRMSFRPLIEILQALGQKAGVAVRTEPGALQSLPRQVRMSFTIIAKDVPVEQVLDRIAAETGLGYLIEPDGVLFFKASEHSGAPSFESMESTSPDVVSDPYVGKIVVPLPDGKTAEWLIRRSELPPDLRAIREQDLQAAFEAIRAKAASK